MLISTPIAPTPITGTCLLGVSLNNPPFPLILATDPASILLPNDPNLGGFTFAAQGADSGGPTGFQVSDTLVITLH
jgi:hypothetical protein